MTDTDALAGDTITDTADCPAGKVVLGGGSQLTIGPGGFGNTGPRFYISTSRAIDADTWQVTLNVVSAFSGTNGTTQDDATVAAQVICTV